MKKIFGILLALALVLSLSLVATTPVAASSPPVTSGLVLHLDADAITGLSDGNKVATWTDLSGEGNHATQATEANRPTYKTNVLNGRAIVRFDTDGSSGGSNWLNLPDFLSGDTEGEIFAVLYIKNDPPAHTDFSGIWRFGTSGSNTHYPWTDGNSYLDWGRNTRFGPIGTVIESLENPHILNIKSAAQWTVRQDGNVAWDTTSGTVGFRTNPAIGISPASNRFFNGYFAEILIYNRALSDAERQGVEQYLGRKWLGWGTACIATATSSGTACITTSHGIMADLVARAAPSLPSVSFPHGMFNFKITGLSTGQTVTLTIELPAPVPVGTVWWKYDNGRWYSLPNLNDNGNNIMKIRLTDGGAGDSDGAKNGIITDPGGPGNPMTVGWDGSPVSKAAVWAPWIALLAAIMAGAGLLVWRRRRAQI